MRRVARLALLHAVCILSCRPDFGERESRIDRTRVLAVRIDPPEAKPGETVTTTLLVASPGGPVAADVPSSWAFCATPKPLTENGAVSAACLANGVVPIGDARGGVSAVLPANSCFDFGPETQSADVRPRDPDVTGGFFAPIRARLAGDGSEQLTAFGFARVSCNLANAAGSVAAQFQDQYRPNKAPTLLPLEAHDERGASVALDAIPRGGAIVLRAAWRPEDAETYVVYDLRELAIAPRRESLRVSWFSTAGSFDRDRTGRTEEEFETSSDNAWTAPDDARTSHLWVVLRDARGGVTFAYMPLITR